MPSKFQADHSYESRKHETDLLLQKFPGRIPVVCEKAEGSDIPTINRMKYLVDSDNTVGQFKYIIRKRSKLTPEKAIFLFVGDVIPPTSALMSTMYAEYKNEDSYLYVTYSGENTFGDERKVEWNVA